jgi:hypothetical protein
VLELAPVEQPCPSAVSGAGVGGGVAGGVAGCVVAHDPAQALETSNDSSVESRSESTIFGPGGFELSITVALDYAAGT